MLSIAPHPEVRRENWDWTNVLVKRARLVKLIHYNCTEVQHARRLNKVTSDAKSIPGGYRGKLGVLLRS